MTSEPRPETNTPYSPNITVEFHDGNGKYHGYDDTHTFPEAFYDLSGDFIIIGYKTGGLFNKRDVIPLSNIKRFSFTNQQQSV